MTAANSASDRDLWNWDFLAPRPAQDTDLLAQLNFIPGLKEVLMLRQVHALEHATVWVLSESHWTNQNTAGRQKDNQLLSGVSTERGFYLYGEININQLRQAVRIALQRLTRGEWDLAVHPRCGTNLSVSMVLTAAMCLGASALLPRGPIEQMLGLGLAASTAAQIAPDLGLIVQKYVTTSIPFNLAIAEVAATPDFWGRSAHFVRVQWRD